MSIRTCLPLFVLVLVACSDDETTSSSSSSGSSSGGNECTAARDQHLAAVDSVSTATVTVLSDQGGIKTVFVDASAGGPQGAAQNPRVYLDLGSVSRVEVKDTEARTSTAWDLAIKRPILFTNSGDAAGGQGGSAFLAGKDITAVTSADAASATFKSEELFDDQCNAALDPTGAIKTSFDGWYQYDTATNKLSPTAGTWLVKGGTGKTYKVRITGYYANPDGTVGMAGGRYLLEVGAL